jgi:5-(carboxyamino)imidazole ribonucleotide synthase
VAGRSCPHPRTRLAAALTVPGAHVHLYGKVARPGRKLGHVTCLGHDRAEVRERALQAVALLTGETKEGTSR